MVTSLLGIIVSWSDKQEGYQRGIVVGVSDSFDLIVLINGNLRLIYFNQVTVQG